MAWRQGHLVDETRVPGADDVTAAVGVVLQLLDELDDLVCRRAVGVGPRAPLVTVDRPEVSVLVGPFIPDGDPIFVEIADIRIARQKPQKFVDNRLHMEFFRGQHRKALRKVKPHLMAENGTCAGACPVAAFHAIINNALE